MLACRIAPVPISTETAAWATSREVVAALAARIAASLRGGDALGWIGDGELAIVASDLLTERDLLAIGDRFLAASKRPVRLRDGSVRLGRISVGIAATALDPAATSHQLLEAAGEAAAAAGRDDGDRCVVFDAELRARTELRRQLAGELRPALDHGQLEVHYQPVVELSGGAVDHLEALVRWPHPVRGMIHPASFLTAAAGSGLMVEIGEVVLETACRQATAWSTAAGRPVRVSVNVSREQLLGSDLVASVERALALASLPASQLLLEVAETVIEDQLSAVILVLRRLAPSGVTVVIDRASGGPATFWRLGRLPNASVVKLDPALVEGMSDRTIEPSVLAAAAAHANRLGISMVAAGVEFVEQVHAIRAAGVDWAQGFVFQRPSPAPDLLPLLVSGCPAAQAPAVELTSFER